MGAGDTVQAVLCGVTARGDRWEKQQKGSGHQHIGQQNRVDRTSFMRDRTLTMGKVGTLVSGTLVVVVVTVRERLVLLVRVAVTVGGAVAISGGLARAKGLFGLFGLWRSEDVGHLVRRAGKRAEREGRGRREEGGRGENNKGNPRRGQTCVPFIPVVYATTQRIAQRSMRSMFCLAAHAAE